MGLLFLHCLCLMTVLSISLANCTITDDEEPRRTYPIRRAIDGTRGRKYYVPEEDNPYDDYGSSNGHYDPYEQDTSLSDIRNNVPGEPGVDYPAYTRLPQTEFVCEGHFRGYYADEGAGCQVFHVCDASFLVSSFLCPIGSIFSQKLLTCDWWNKVDCSLTRNYHAINSQSLMSEVDDDEILRKAFEMASVQSAGERIPVETLSQQQESERHNQDRRNQRVLNYGSAVTERSNELSTGQEQSYSDYSDYPARLSSRYKSIGDRRNRQRYHEADYYTTDVKLKAQQLDNDDDDDDDDDDRSLRIHVNGEDRKNDRQDSFRNEFQPSYSPTVPTVMTTARRYYSPTIPTTYRPTTTRNAFRRYDLEFESSDHLYTARGRSNETVKAVTPASAYFVGRAKSKLTNVSPPSFINSVVDTTDPFDRMEESESSQKKIQLPIVEAHGNISEVESFNDTETIMSLNDKERAVQENLDILTKKIMETLSILTIDNENRDPAVFSYSHDEKIGGENVKDTFESSSAVNSTNSSLTSDLNKAKKPVTFLQPPKEKQSQFRITVLDETSKRLNETFLSPEVSVNENFTKEFRTVQAPAIGTTPPISSDENDIRESRIIRIIANNNNATDPESSEESKKPEILIEQVKSIDLSPGTILGLKNFTETKIITEVNDDSAEMAKSTEGSSLNSTKLAKFVSASSTIVFNETTQREKISKLKDSFDFVGIDATGNDSNATKKLPPIETIAAISSAVKDDSKQSIPSEEIFFNATNIEDTIELGSSPLQVTLSIDKNEEFDPNGDVIRKLIAQQEIGDSIGAANYKSFEIVRSDEQQAPPQNGEINHFNYDTTTSLENDEGTASVAGPIANENLPNFQSNSGLQSTNYLRSIVGLVSGPNLPRPFSFEQPDAPNVNIKALSDLGDQLISTSFPSFSQTRKNFVTHETTRAPIPTTRSVVSSAEEPDSEKSLETLVASSSSGLPRDLNDNNRPVSERSSRTFGERKLKINGEKLIFELPQTKRSFDFETGLRLEQSEESTARIQEERINASIRSNETNEKMEKIQAETVVQTEFIPSLGFSLNTDEEREEYMEAVVKGLLEDVSARENTNNETSTSHES